MKQHWPRFLWTQQLNQGFASHVQSPTHSKVDQELERLEQAGVIKPVQFADWAAPIVPVAKRDSSIRICDDFKVTINHATKVDTYPLQELKT